MDKEQVKETLRLHSLWIYGMSEGVQANLSDADLSDADLRGALEWRGKYENLIRQTIETAPAED